MAKDKQNKVLLYCIDKRLETMYITAELEKKHLVIRYSHFKSLGKYSEENFIYKYDVNSTKKFMELISETEFLSKLKEKFNKKDALEKIAEFSAKNQLKYKVFNHFNEDEYNPLRYDFGDIYEDVDRLYYEDGSIIIPSLYEHLENGTVKIYTANGHLYMEISYKNNLKDGKAKCYYEDSDTLMWEQNYTKDLLDGKAKTYYSDGEWKTEELFENGQLKDSKTNSDHAEAYYVY